jgi:DNA replication protein
MTILGSKKGNITATFGSELIMQGSTSIPNLLLKYYKKLRITESEMMVLIMLIHFRESYRDFYPSATRLAEMMTQDEYIIRTDLALLMEKQLLALTEYFNFETNSVHSTYDFAPLFERISEFWACDEMIALQKVQEILKDRDISRQKENQAKDLDLAKVYKTFEQEFGRLLSPMEIDQIRDWLANTPSVEVLLKALKTSVLQGKRSFKYMDSILFEWKKKGIQSLSDIEESEEKYMQNKNKRKPAPKVPTNNDKNSSEDTDLDLLFIHRG